MVKWIAKRVGPSWRTSVALSELAGGSALRWYLAGYQARVTAIQRYTIEAVMEAVRRRGYSW